MLPHAGGGIDLRMEVETVYVLNVAMRMRLFLKCGIINYTTHLYNTSMTRAPDLNIITEAEYSKRVHPGAIRYQR